MRKLTKPEIDAAPSWARFYSIQKDKPYFTERYQEQKGLNYKPIPRKEFDITKYKFSDGDMDVLIEGEGRVLISVDPDRSIFAELSTEDIIALAKHKKITTDDLK